MDFDGGGREDAIVVFCDEVVTNTGYDTIGVVLGKLR
jgi:hypothetical protein